MRVPQTPAETKASPDDLHPLLESTPLALVVFDQAGRILQAAGADAQALLGSSLPTLGVALEELPDASPSFLTLVRTALTGQLAAGEIKLLTGRIVFVHVAPNGKGAVAMVTPAQPLRDNDEAFLRLFQASPVPISISTMERGIFSHCNDAFVRVFGYPREEVVGHGSVELGMWTPEERASAINKLREKGVLSGHESTVRTKQGDMRDTIFNMERIELLGQTRLVGFFFDITERKRAEAEQRRLVEQLREMDQLKSQLMANVSHELRTPLTLILGLTDRVLRSSTLAQSSHTDLVSIQRNAQILLKQVNDLLDVARLDSGLVKARFTNTDLARLVQLVASPFDVIANERDIEYTLTTPSVCWAEVDGEKIERVIANLLSNAFKFTPRGGKVRCTLSTLDDGRVRIAVDDSGPGIAEENRDKVFERFFQVEGSATRIHGGTGLGLAIVREFAELHRGHAGASASPEGGARLLVDLPIKAPEGALVHAAAEEAREKPNAQTISRLVMADLFAARKGDATPNRVDDIRPLILVVEDNAEMRDFIATSLGSAYRVVAAADGEEGLEKTIALRPALVITDIMMPRRSGDQLVAALRARPDLAEIPIIVLSAKAEDGLRARLLRDGAQDYLTKPFSVEELLARVENQIALKSARERAELERAAAERANQAKSEFLSSMSHELRTPLNGILGYAQILERSPTLAPSDRSGVSVIKQSGEHLLMLINDVLDLAKIEAGKMELVPREMKLSNVLRTVGNLSKVRANEKGIGFKEDFSGPIEISLLADEKRLMQVLLNLLSNAIKFTETGNVTFGVSVAKENISGARQLIFRIEDTGPGIEEAHRARIFLPFEQVGDSTKKNEGTGLGLSITKNIVELMGGSIDVSSTIGQGSVFRVIISLPEAKRHEDVLSPASWTKVAGYEGERRALLIVDDKTANREMLKELLAPLGFDVMLAESGDIALKLARSRRPDLVLMDLTMPGMDGFETTRQMRKTSGLEGVVVIACSAGLSEKIRQDCRLAGCDGFLAKPVDADQLFQQLSERLGLRWIYEPESLTAHAKNNMEQRPRQSPPAEALSHLKKLASQGRLQEFVSAANEIKQKNPSLRAWVDEANALCDSFALTELEAFLHSS